MEHRSPTSFFLYLESRHLKVVEPRSILELKTITIRFWFIRHRFRYIYDSRTCSSLVQPSDSLGTFFFFIIRQRDIHTFNRIFPNLIFLLLLFFSRFHERTKKNRIRDFYHPSNCSQYPIAMWLSVRYMVFVLFNVWSFIQFNKQECLWSPREWDKMAWESGPIGKSTWFGTYFVFFVLACEPNVASF